MNIRASFPEDVTRAEPVRRPMVTFENISKRFDQKSQSTLAVDAVDLTIRRGEFVAFVGPSGCGKTTLLNLAAGLLKPDQGGVWYDGLPLTTVNTRVGYLTQTDALLPWRSVLANVTLPLEIRRVPAAERRQRALAILDRVGLKGFERHLPAQLSGGMRKRAALARTLVYQPETLLLDEPFSALDAQTRFVMQKQLKQLVDDLGLTVILVTHDLDEAIKLAHRIVVFSHRPARILEDTAVEAQQPHVATPKSSGSGSLHERLWALLAPEIEPETAA
ncbi:MAG: transporter related [Hyphomicrobiales bacterium]|nr:transporter related [Hyphomicrobiales bacterium]